MPESSNPAELQPHDPAWARLAAEQLEAIKGALSDLVGADVAGFDHIGSTSVAGLAAKPFVDLQVRILPLPSEADLAERLGPIGYSRAHGARGDSPGVRRDTPVGSELVRDEVWDKRVFTGTVGSTILHVRASDSPWARDTLWFRDWLRANPDARDRYESVKRELSAQNRGKPDYDDYTRAKSAYFAEVRAAFVSWASVRGTETGS